MRFSYINKSIKKSSQNGTDYLCILKQVHFINWAYSEDLESQIFCWHYYPDFLP